MRAAIYARVSTSDQNCEMQLRELREYLGAAAGTRRANTSMRVTPVPRRRGRRSIG